jgi:ATP-dependent Clp protease ATP-binding subunit ClpX
MPKPSKLDVKLQASILAVGRWLSLAAGATRQVTPRRSDQNGADALDADVEKVLRAVRASPARKYFGLKQGEGEDDAVRLKAVALIAWLMIGEPTCSGYLEEIAKAVVSHKGEQCEQLLFAREVLARMVGEGLLALDASRAEQWSGRLTIVPSTYVWMCGGNQSLGHFDPARLTSYRLGTKDQAVAAAAAPPKRLPTAKELFDKVRQEVVGLDPQVKVLASRIALHVARAEMLAAGMDDDSVGQMVVCLVGSSGAGKSFLAGRVAAASGLPMVQYDATTLTSQGYTGDDLDSPYRLLTSSVGGDAKAASRGLIFLDEFDKKSTHHGREVCGLAIQQEVLGKLQATSPFVVGGKRQYDCRPYLFDGRPTGYFLAGVFSGVDEVIEKQSGRRGIGFASEVGTRQHVRIQDALKELGFLDELVNRIGVVLRLPDPTVENVMRAAADGILHGFNRVLDSKGIVLFPTDAAIRAIGGYAVESKTFYRGAKAILATIVEEAIFDPHRGTVVIEVGDVRRAVDRLSSGGIGGENEPMLGDVFVSSSESVAESVPPADPQPQEASG